MERSFAREVGSLSLGAGEVFHGEGILAVTKALLQSGVSYIGGYQGAPVSHLIDVLGDARDLLDELGIYFENSASEAGAAAMLGASIHYPVRGAVTWKSTVGTNVASDALSNLASAGVTGGALIILGEDYGDGSSIIQERTHAFTMKSQIWLMDPRPNLTSIVDAVEQDFQLSEASQTPVMMQLRIRACHVHGSFVCKDNVAPAISTRQALREGKFDYSRINLPPSIYEHERQKVQVRWPAALEHIRRAGLNETFPGTREKLGLIVPGGLYNGLIRALQQLGLADVFGASEVPIHVLNVVYPLVPDALQAFCAGKDAVLIVEEGQPNYLEEALTAMLRRAGLPTRVHGKDVFPLAGEYNGEVMLRGVAAYLDRAQPDASRAAAAGGLPGHKQAAVQALGEPVPNRPPGFCVGCPERPVFSAIKMVQQKLGPLHVSADIGCHTFGTLAPFNIGSTVLGYGLGLASSSGIAPLMGRRVVSVMGDGGFWHNGFTSGVVNAMYNNQDSVLVILKNGYTSATGTQAIPSSPSQPAAKPLTLDIETALRRVGVKWLRKVPSYQVADMKRTLDEAMTTEEGGLKVIIADGECQLERQRRIKPQNAQRLKQGLRVVRTRFGIDEDVCTGDHSCIRLSGCPSLSVKPNPSPLRSDPVATVNQGCVGCGLCGEVAHAAQLCPSFFKAEIVQNPGRWERRLARWRERLIHAMAGRARLPREVTA
ncbi:indolepyruvate ferredoxin oxidoreductase subunit alpha [Bordetella holmesii]|uniref:Thiamine pyrophosphate enzyme, C-terminal TPP binding domain protein n=2 Tax=Bordetella holmesii TaxID=35814 RepID=A0A158M4K4_9BORD|nr:indolepyruvate ferredoxin oxidoreductase subunit alpha [Bordetella holmesii]AHV94775.1 thiamine pyrophosphate enzyme, C-terminal TPP binding domain protein [Bordetella holmesii ATCC 51541]AIT25624.1 thiamine pyrophosphate enzyme, C-terminal TPP binding domain protein [Bordetella holmesii 44057]EWM43166.1 thiamine pyrophosphate enzyme, C-terminal TPP binding domain protein [Bordetella holmesii 41130]EWM46193.1 thiamine pyrophosphate enzyme, C-terminal TPP binding domain protein [Bordetella ho